MASPITTIFICFTDISPPGGCIPASVFIKPDKISFFLNFLNFRNFNSKKIK